MQDGSPPTSAASSLPLLDEIRRGGKMAALFRQAAGAQSAATRQILRGRKLETLLDTLMGDVRRRQEAGKANSLTVLHECAAGCTACCRASLVEVTPLEALAVAQYLQTRLTPAELATLRARLSANAQQRFQWRNGTSSGEVPPCAFLGEDGQCQTYDARPLVCAGVYSFSRAACHMAVPGPSETNVPLDRSIKAWTMGQSGGLQQGLVAQGLDGNLYELHSAVLCALETERAFDRWWRKEDIFANCHCTDPHSPPRKPALPNKNGTQWRIDKSHPLKKRDNGQDGAGKRVTVSSKKRSRR